MCNRKYKWIMKQTNVLRSIALLLVLLILLSGCSASQTGSEGIAASASDDNTVSSSISTSIPTGLAENEQSNMAYKEFVGTWAEEATYWSCGGMILDVAVVDNSIILDYKYYSPAPESYIASFSKTIPIVDIVDNRITISYEDDGWSHSGKVMIEFSEDAIKCLFYGIDFEGADWGVWGFDSGEFVLNRNDQIYENMQYTQEDYDSLYNSDDYDDSEPDLNPEPTYDTSKASGILAQAGLTEQEFRNICTYIGSKYNDNNAYVYAVGQEYYAQHPEESKRIEDYTMYWNDYLINGRSSVYYTIERESVFKASNNLEDFLNYMVYGPKGASILGKQSEEILNRMQEYPADYVNQVFLLKNFRTTYVSNYVYTDDCFVIYNADISVVDYRDDPDYPKILQGHLYDMYVIFMGIDDYGDLVFALISVEKCA